MCDDVVRVKLGNELTTLVGAREIQVSLTEDLSIREFLCRLADSHSKYLAEVINEGGELGSILVILNGERISRSEFEKRKVRKGDTIHLIPPILGG